MGSERSRRSPGAAQREQSRGSMTGPYPVACPGNCHNATWLGSGETCELVAPWNKYGSMEAPAAARSLSHAARPALLASSATLRAAEQKWPRGGDLERLRLCGARGGEGGEGDADLPRPPAVQSQVLATYSPIVSSGGGGTTQN